VIKNPNQMQEGFTCNPSKYPQKNFKPKPCKWCGQIFEPQGPSHHYCTDVCRKEVYADKHYRRTYGVGYKWVKDTLSSQGGVCALCGAEGFKMRDDHVTGLNLDHCHQTGVPRGLLCHNCNRGLGLFKDNADLLRKAADYLEKHRDP
jgi:hypothetical protein